MWYDTAALRRSSIVLNYGNRISTVQLVFWGPTFSLFFWPRTCRLPWHRSTWRSSFQHLKKLWQCPSAYYTWPTYPILYLPPIFIGISSLPPTPSWLSRSSIKTVPRVITPTKLDRRRVIMVDLAIGLGIPVLVKVLTPSNPRIDPTSLANPTFCWS